MEGPITDDIFELQSRVEIGPAPPLFANSVVWPPSDTEATGGDHYREQYDPPFSESPLRCLTFTKHKGGYHSERPIKLQNSLLIGVGFLEAANAGDFAANVWNQVPVPVYAVVLMAIGGTVALSIIYFAVKDALLSWRNLRGLRAERRYLRTQRALHGRDMPMVRTLDCLLDVNFREMGTEWVDRFGLDVLMGFGALVVGIGTFLAIDGTNRTAFLVSNLMSGYIGNAPCAVYGVANLVWSMYVWRRAYRHAAAGSKALTITKVDNMLRMRTSSVKMHGALNGITGIVAGAASLATATMWWGYVVLAPCLVTSVFVNFLWRHRIGYSRPLVLQVVPFNEDGLISELIYVSSCRHRAMKSQSQSISRLVSDPTSIECLIEFIVRHQIFEELCLRILGDEPLRTSLFNLSGESVAIDADALEAIHDQALCGRLLQLAQQLIADAAPRCFFDQERYLLEALGCYLCLPSLPRENRPRDSRIANQKKPSQQPKVYTPVGRHSDAWLFGGLCKTGQS